MKKLLILFSSWLVFFCLFAQEERNHRIPSVSTGPFWLEDKSRNLFVNQSTLIGIGQTLVFDTYLSPLPYDGRSFSLLHDRLHGSRFFDNRLLFQQQFHLQFANTTNPVGNAIAYFTNVSYHLNGFLPVVDVNDFRFFVGGGIDASIGGIYNTRNTNNPGSAKASSNFNLAVMARYNWHLPFWNRNRVTFRWQLGTPLAGVFFSPAFGQSYYEIFELGNTNGVVHFGSLHNQQGLRNYFTVDIPLRNVTVRAGYLGNFYRTDVNHLNTRISSHQFLIGLVWEQIRLGGGRNAERIQRNSVFY